MLAGPGVPIATVTRDASLVDIVPTLLPLLGLPLDERTAQVLPGSSFFDSEVPNKKHFFACYFDGHCYGYVQGNKKVVVAKNRRKSWYFDLSNDPQEHESKELTSEMRASLPELFRLVDAHRTNAKQELQALQPSFGEWECEARGRCRHPESPPGLFFETPGD